MQGGKKRVLGCCFSLGAFENDDDDDTRKG
jgi:hypothetical protein